MIQQVTLTDISILDKMMLFNALNERAVSLQQNAEKESQITNLKHISLSNYSICSVLIASLNKSLSNTNVWGMTANEKAAQNKRLTLETFKAITVYYALLSYKETAEDYQRARIDHIVQQIHKQLI